MDCISLLILPLVATQPTVSWLTVIFLRRHAGKWGLLDQPDDRKVHTTPIPLGAALGFGSGHRDFLMGSVLVMFNGSVTR